MAGLSSTSLFTDDDDDLLPAASGGKNKLGSLFGSSQPAKGNDSLQYNRPKQPKREDETKTKKPEGPQLPPLLVAIAVHLHKLENNKWTPMGKVGCAIVENKTQATKYQLTLYQSKTSVLCQVPINANFTCTPQFSNNEYFSNLYDTKNQNWSFKYESLQDAETLAANLVLAKYYDNPKSGQLIVQDVFVPSKGAAVDNGDTLGIRYVTHTLNNEGKLKAVEDNLEQAQPKKVVLGSNKSAPGWEDALRGLKRTQRISVLVPPGYGGETEAKVYNFFLDKVKRSESAATAEKQASVTPAPPPTSPGPDGDLELPNDSSKASIMKRMKKMGAVALPGQSVDDEISVTDATEAATPSPPQPAVHITPTPAVAPTPVMQQPSLTQPLPQQPYAQQPGMPGVGYPMGYPNAMGTPTPATGYSPNLALTHPALAMSPVQNQFALVAPQQFPQPYITPQPAVVEAPKPAAPTAPAEESKSMSPETIKLLVEEHQFKANINTKLDGLNSRVDEVLERMDNTIFTKNKDIGPGVSAKALLQTIQRIVTENEKFAIELEARNQKIDALTEKLNKFHETNQRVIEENNRFMEERTVNFKAATEQTMKQLEQYREEKAQLEQELNTCERKFQTLKRAYTNLSTEVEQYKDQAEKSKATADALQARFSALEAQLVETEGKLRDEQLNFKKLQTEFASLQAELADERELSAKLRKTVEDNKARYIAELQRREAAHEEERTSLEEAVAALREALARERAKLGTHQEQLEKELEEKWQAKLRQALETQRKDLESRHQQTLEAQQVNLDAEWRKRLEEQRKENRAVIELQEQVQLLTGQIQNYIQREEVARQTVSALQQQNKQLAAQLAAAAGGSGVAVAAGGASSAEVVALRQQLAAVKESLTATVKMIMNNVYTTLNSQFEPEVSYTKDDIMVAIRETIVQTTMALIKKQAEEEEEAAAEEPVATAPEATPAEPAEKGKPEEPEPTPSTESGTAVESASEVVEEPAPASSSVSQQKEQASQPAAAAAAAETKPEPAVADPKPAKKKSLFFDEDEEEEPPKPQVAAPVAQPAAKKVVFFDDGEDSTPVVKSDADPLATLEQTPAANPPSSSPAPIATNTSPAPARKSLFFDEDDEEPSTLFAKPSTPKPSTPSPVLLAKKPALFDDGDEVSPTFDPLAPLPTEPEPKPETVPEPIVTPAKPAAAEKPAASTPLTSSTASESVTESSTDEQPGVDPLALAPASEAAVDPLASSSTPPEPTSEPVAESVAENSASEQVANPLASSSASEPEAATAPATEEEPTASPAVADEPVTSPLDETKPAETTSAEPQQEPEPITIASTLEVPIPREDRIESMLSRDNSLAIPDAEEAKPDDAQPAAPAVESQEVAATTTTEEEKWDEDEPASSDPSTTTTTEASTKAGVPPLPTTTEDTAEAEVNDNKAEPADLAKNVDPVFNVTSNEDDDNISAPPRKVPYFDSLGSTTTTTITSTNTTTDSKPAGPSTTSLFDDPIAPVAPAPAVEPEKPKKPSIASSIFGDPLGGDKPAATEAPAPAPASTTKVNDDDDLFNFTSKGPSTPAATKSQSSLFDDVDFPIPTATKSAPSTATKKTSLDSIFGDDTGIETKPKPSATKPSRPKGLFDDDDDTGSGLFD